MRRQIAALDHFEQKLRGLHPENLTVAQFTEMRSWYLTYIKASRELNNAFLELLATEANDGRRNSQGDHRG